MELFVERGQNYTFLLEVIISYLKLSERGRVRLIEVSHGTILAQKKGQLKFDIPSLITEDGDVLTEIFQICKKLFEILPQWKEFFLGKSQQQQNEINSIKTHLKEGKQLRKYLQKHLETRTFFVSNHLTFADFYMFTQLYDNIIQMTDEQKNQYNNLFRWYKHIQNLPQIRGFLQLNKRILVNDPQNKLGFLPEKKKTKKDKEVKKVQTKKQDVVKQQIKQEVEVLSEEKAE